MKQSKIFLQFLDTGIFPCAVCFSVGLSHEEIMQHFKKVKAKDWSEVFKDEGELVKSTQYLSMKRILKGKTYFAIVITRRFNFSDWDMVMLAHEILHTCQFMLPELLDRNREYECEAYLHSHLMTQALKHLRK
jgi:hypothetical protein